MDVLGFIGGVKGADALIKGHPSPHRLKVFSQLEGKNLGIVLPDADLDVAAAQCTLGATSYNGQRCTAIKVRAASHLFALQTASTRESVIDSHRERPPQLIMVHESVADAFVAKLVAKVSALKVGMPWEDGVTITPLPEPTKPKFLQELVADGLKHGATVANGASGGGEVAGALMTPAVIDGVTPAMRLFHEEQFGPVVPVARYRDLSEVRGSHAVTRPQRAPDPDAAAPTLFTAGH